MVPSSQQSVSEPAKKIDPKQLLSKVQHKHLVRVWVIFQNGYCHFSFGGMRCKVRKYTKLHLLFMGTHARRTPATNRLNKLYTYLGVKLAQNIWNVITLAKCRYLLLHLYTKYYLLALRAISADEIRNTFYWLHKKSIFHCTRHHIFLITLSKYGWCQKLSQSSESDSDTH